MLAPAVVAGPSAVAAPDGGGATGVAGARPTLAPTGAHGQPVVGWRPPVADPLEVLRGFAAPAERWSPGHRGVDVAATAGATVLAPADGVVTYAGTVVDRGVLVLDHAGDLRSSFEPVAPLLPVGSVVRRGDVVGLRSPALHGGCPDGCLHWGVRRGRGAAAAYLDPLSLLGPPEPPVLLPLAPRGLPAQG